LFDHGDSKDSSNLKYPLVFGKFIKKTRPALELSLVEETRRSSTQK